MVLKLDSRFPLLWRSPSDIQFGVDPAQAQLFDVSPGEERVIAALVAGVSRSGLTMIGASAGVTSANIDALLRGVAPALQPGTDLTAEPATSTGTGTTSDTDTDTTTGSGRTSTTDSSRPVPRQPNPPTIDLVGRGLTVQRISRTLRESGQRVVLAESATDTPGSSRARAAPTPGARRGTHPDQTSIIEPSAIGIAVGHYVLAPDLHGYWLRRDIPHLPVVFGDTSVTIGPMIEPGLGPCLYCLERYRTDADPVWPTIAAQLWGRHSQSETPLLSRETAARVVRIVLDRLAEARPGPTVSVRVSAGRDRLVYREETAHPGCGCREEPSAARPGNDLPDVPDLGALPRRTRIVRVSGARE